MVRIFVIFSAILVVAGMAFIYITHHCEDDGSAGSPQVWCYIFEAQKIRAADNFERCANLGFPIMESYPAQCRAGDKLFVQKIPPRPRHDMILVEFPTAHEIIKSPLTIKGEARGNWYFEASFPVRLLDADGNSISLDPPYITAASEWMTTEFVPYETTHTFIQPAVDTGTLILQKDNPSGMPEFDDSISIPVRFK